METDGLDVGQLLDAQLLERVASRYPGAAVCAPTSLQDREMPTQEEASHVIDESSTTCLLRELPGNPRFQNVVLTPALIKRDRSESRTRKVSYIPFPLSPFPFPLPPSLFPLVRARRPQQPLESGLVERELRCWRRRFDLPPVPEHHDAPAHQVPCTPDSAAGRSVGSPLVMTLTQYDDIVSASLVSTSFQV